MKSVIQRVVFVVGLSASVTVFSRDLCAQLPPSLQNVSVSYISQPSDLHKLDEQLEGHLQPCLAPLNAENRQAICTYGRIAAEQALRVVARIDEAGKKNPHLKNAKMKTYKTGVVLLDQMKKLSADKTCV